MSFYFTHNYHELLVERHLAPSCKIMTLINLLLYFPNLNKVEVKVEVEVKISPFIFGQGRMI